MVYAGEFKTEGFKLIRIRKFNKKMRRHLGIPKDEIKSIIVARGTLKFNGTEKFIMRTAEIVDEKFDKDDGYLYFKTCKGKQYKV